MIEAEPLSWTVDQELSQKIVFEIHVETLSLPPPATQIGVGDTPKLLCPLTQPGPGPARSLSHLVLCSAVLDRK